MVVRICSSLRPCFPTQIQGLNFNRGKKTFEIQAQLEAILLQPFFLHPETLGEGEVVGHAQRGDLAILNSLFSLFSKKAMKLIFIQQTRIFQLSKLNFFLSFTKLFFAVLQF